MKSESESSSLSSPPSFCDGTAETSAAAMSSHSPIDGEEIIKMEEVPSSSSNFDRGVTEIRVKEEEEVVDGTSTSTSTSTITSNMNCDLNRSVKREHESDTTAGAYYNNDTYDYSNWKTGDWCWLLPATATRSVTSKDGSNNNSADTVAVSDNSNNNTDPYDCRKSEETFDTNTTNAINGNTRRLTRQCRSINDEDDGSTAEAASRPKKKKRYKGDSSMAANTNSNTTKQTEQCVEEEREYHKNKNTIVDNGVDSNSSSNDDVDYTDNVLKQSNNSTYEGDDGYESWTEGNWCLLLPPSSHSDNIDDTKQQSYDLPSAAHTTIRSRRCRRLPSSTHTVDVNIGDKNENVLDEDYAENDDYNNDDDDSTRKKARKGTIRYTKKQNKKWTEMYQKLVAYKQEHISTNVPRGYVRDPKLGNWVHRQRRCYTTKDLCTERINKLESIDFIWNLDDAKWMKMYQKLLAYKIQHGSTKVPWRYVDDPQLGIWVISQRQVYNNTTSGILSEKRMGLLNSINFAWSAKQDFLIPIKAR